MVSIFGYSVLPVALGEHGIQLPAASTTSTGLHKFMYARKHRSRGADSNDTPTLFVSGIPKEIEHEEIVYYLKKYFEAYAGKVVSVALGEGEYGSASRTAYVTFDSEVSLRKAVSTEKIQLISTCSESDNDEHIISYTDDEEEIFHKQAKETAVQRSVRKYRTKRATRHQLQSETDAFIVKFEDKVAEVEAEKQKRRDIMDADGFTLVGGKREITFGAIEKGRKKGSRKRRKGDGAKELQHFYRFQVREGKRDKLALLREKFQQDKQRVAQMKAARRFKAF